jgi:PPOX class probable F420-dependent enzyme
LGDYREDCWLLREITPEVQSFLEGCKVPGVLSTLSPKGAPITSAVWFGLADGAIVISTPADRPKARNARLDARVSFIVDTKAMPYRGVAIEGRAEVLDDPDKSLMRGIAMRYLGPELPDYMAERIARSDRVVLRIRPTRVRPWNIVAAPAPE